MRTKNLKNETITTIAETLKLSRERAKMVKSVLRLERCAGFKNFLDKNCPHTKKWIDSCYHLPKTAEIQMHAIDEIIGTYGVEAINLGDVYPGNWLEYCNTGDPFINTVCLYEGKFFLTSWGDIIESEEM